MSPAYHNLQLVVLDKRDKSYQAGDVVAFSCGGLSSVLVKRVVAVGGDTVRIEDCTLYVNGEISTLYDEGVFEYSGILRENQQLEEGKYIVIGDNIEQSKDSRYEEIGIISVDIIIGKIIKLLPHI